MAPGTAEWQKQHTEHLADVYSSPWQTSILPHGRIVQWQTQHTKPWHKWYSGVCLDRYWRWILIHGDTYIALGTMSAFRGGWVRLGTSAWTSAWLEFRLWLSYLLGFYDIQSIMCVKQLQFESLPHDWKFEIQSWWLPSASLHVHQLIINTAPKCFLETSNKIPSGKPIHFNLSEAQSSRDLYFWSLSSVSSKADHKDTDGPF